MNYRHYFLVMLLLVLCPLALHSQQRTLTLDELFALADANSKALQVSDYGIKAAHEEALGARNSRLPSVNASLSGSYIGDGYLCDRDFKNGMRIDMPHFGNNFALQVAQVLYAGGAINSGIALADLGEQMADLEFSQKQQEVRFLLTGYYLDIFKLSNQLKVYDENIALTEQLLQSLRDREQEGLALKNDVTRFELQLEGLRLQREHIANGKEIINYQLNQVIGLDANVEICPDTTLLSYVMPEQGETE